MKDACTRTGLTERTIRFYIEKGLLTPQQEEMNGRTLTFFGEEDLQRLEEVSVLRKAGFSIDSIVTMTKYPQTIGDILQEQLAAAEQNAADSRAVLEQLRTAAGQRYDNVHSLYEALNREPVRNIPVPHTDREPNFSQFEDATEQERLDGIVDYVIAQRKTKERARKRKSILRMLITTLCLVLVFGVIYGWSCIPHHISRTYDCIQYQRFGLSSKPYEIYADVRVTVEGDLYRPLLKAPYFSGDITVEQIGDVTENMQFPAFGEKYGYTLKEFSPFGGDLVYLDAEDHEYLLGQFAFLDNKYDEMAILLFTPFNFEEGVTRFAGSADPIIVTKELADTYGEPPQLYQFW
ncbi:MAG: MerR family transcriptional regulator [Clostridia bacterium]|nr:MerR family transcriptional regulator [Clostridia bacterium]